MAYFLKLNELKVLNYYQKKLQTIQTNTILTNLANTSVYTNQTKQQLNLLFYS